MDKDVVLNKLESLRRCIVRIEEKKPDSLEALIQDFDLQDIIVLNLERAVQTSVDIAMHLVGSLELPVPDTMANSFQLLMQAKIIDPQTAERMKKAVGFRNTAVHAYQQIDWGIVYKIATCHITDFSSFARQILNHLELE